VKLHDGTQNSGLLREYLVRELYLGVEIKTLDVTDRIGDLFQG
jgi:hypothetical protein